MSTIARIPTVQADISNFILPLWLATVMVMRLEKDIKAT